VIAENLKFICHHGKFCESKTTCDLKTIRSEIATAPYELRNVNKKDFFSDYNLINSNRFNPQKGEYP